MKIQIEGDTKLVESNKKDGYIFEYVAPIQEKSTDENNEMEISGIAINVTTTRNGVKFTEEELKLAAKSLSDKPILIDHNNSVLSIVGRNRKGFFADNAVQFKASIMDDKMKEMIADGRVTSVSIGARVKDLVKEKEGSDVLLAKGIDFLELSLVAVPGDPKAGINQSFEAVICEKLNKPTEVKSMAEEETSKPDEQEEQPTPTEPEKSGEGNEESSSESEEGESKTDEKKSAEESLNLKERELALKERELNLKEKELAMQAKKPVKESSEPVDETVGEIVTETKKEIEPGYTIEQKGSIVKVCKEPVNCLGEISEIGELPETPTGGA